jgi:uncharacterized RDD family membrane protein YckC
MKILEFENTQGINLRYEVASPIERIGSFIIDFILISIFSGLTTAAIASMKLEASTMQTIQYLVLVPVVVFYSLVFELLNDGRSLGKMILGIKVIRVDGKEVSTYDFLTRWMFRWIDIYLSGGALAVIAIGASPRGQRIGDMLADTTVIRTKNLRVSLKRLQGLSELKNYTPVFPQVLNLSEEQIFLLSETISRGKKYKNQGHIDATETLAAGLAKELEIEKPPQTEAFLKQLMKDYITLTR